MNRLSGGLVAAALFVAACSGTGAPTTNPQVTAAVGAAQQQLCDSSSQASLKSLATQLSSVDATTDTTALQTNLGKAASNLQSVQVSGTQATLKDAALSAIQSVQAGLSDPATVSQTAQQGASALTALDGALCK